MAPRQDLLDQRTDQILAAAESLAAERGPEALRSFVDEVMGGVEAVTRIVPISYGDTHR